jgi:hypothetical protein
MLSLFLRRFFFVSLGQKFFFSVELLRPLVSVNIDFLKFFIFEVLKKLIKNLTSLRVCSGLFAYAEHTHQELTRTLSVRVRNWCMHWAYASGTGACTEHTHQVLIHAQSAVPLKHAQHKQQELMRTLSIRVRNWCSCWAYASVPYRYAQYTRQKLNAA